MGKDGGSTRETFREVFLNGGNVMNSSGTIERLSMSRDKMNLKFSCNICHTKFNTQILLGKFNSILCDTTYKCYISRSDYFMGESSRTLASPRSWVFPTQSINI